MSIRCPASDELAAQVAQFLASGGQIEEAAPIGYKPRPIAYSYQALGRRYPHRRAVRRRHRAIHLHAYR
ncbi:MULTISPECIES: hypothetical protein [unclassified Pseudomonas]|uniref:hypothetical protein n=1 Tax=unclassified Pseudomonas TaxID=196821 RepID=UPI0034CEED24